MVNLCPQFDFLGAIIDVFTSWRLGYATNNGLTEQEVLPEVAETLTSSLRQIIGAALNNPGKVKKEQ